MSTQSEFLDLSCFEKLKKIGKGSFGKVYIVKEKSTGIIYAGKISISPIMDEQIDTDAKLMVTNLQREININAQLNHPSILKFIGYSPVNFEGKPNPVIITEYSQNGALSSIIKLERHSLSPKEWNDTKKLINIFGIASAMSFLHSNNIIHRDLKPDNILEDDYLFPKICDFGLSKMFHTNKESITVQSLAGIKGTPIYIPPETWNTNDYSKSGDVYAFGLIVYEIMTLEEPFKDFTLPRIMSEVVIHGYRPEIKGPISECYKNLIMHCWSQNPDERPTFDEIVSELKQNEDFIIESIDKDEFIEYIEFVENSKSEFNRSKKFKKITHSKEAVKIIEKDKKIKETSKRKRKDKKEKKESNKKTKTEINIADDKESSDFEQVCKMSGFNNISNKAQDFFIELLTQENHEPKTIIFKDNHTSVLYEKNDLNSQDFISIMKYFNSIFFEIKYPSKNFEEIIDIIHNLVDTELTAIQLRIIASKLDAFKYLENLKNIPLYITIDKKVDMIEDGAFNGCSSLKHILIPDSVLNIGNYAFEGCSSLEQINIPSSVTSMGNFVFWKCKSLKQISLPSGVYIGHNTFKKCLSLTEVSLPSTLTEISGTFAGCSKLSQIKIPFSVESINNKGFKGCSSLTQIKIPASVNYIGIHAFEGCTSLTKIAIPSSVKEICTFAFKGCSSLSEISLPSNVNLSGPGIFEGCSSLIEISLPFIQIIDYDMFKNCSSLTHIEIPTSVFRIEGSAFQGCSSLVQLTIPSSVINIGESTFAKCSSLKELVIPSLEGHIPNNAFNGCSSLTKFSIPISVTYIGSGSFAGCTSLTQISIPPRVRYIDDYAFTKCSSLTEIIIPSSVTQIGNNVFEGCSSLKELLIPSSVKSIGSDCFLECDSLQIVKQQKKIGSKIIYKGKKKAKKV